ncbi:MAG: TonB-dependent receptor [Alphaproteobacteria bacterium]|jgi:vitamin B12 transporter|nr:TonB-dependent receptor [Alphaproteobacteria bacterium]
MKPRLTLVAASLSAIFASQTFAQTAATLDPVVVTATRTAVSLTEVLADVSIVDRDQIERSGAASVSDVLARLPGITISQTGGPASTTGVFIRGAESRFTAVFVDGVRIDSQSTGGATWESIPLAQVERIEVLRGPAAAVYGSDAMAGVVQIFTRDGEPGFHPSIRVGIGSYNTREISTSLRGGEGNVTYALGLAEDKSDGFDAQPNGTNHDRDGYRNRSFSGRLGWKVQPGQKLELTVLDNDQKVGYDGYGSVPPQNDIAKHHLQTVGVNWSSRWSDDWSTRLGMTKGTDRYETTPSVYLTETQVTTYLFHNELRLASGLLTADLERREDELQNSSTRPSANTNRSQNAVALGYGIKLGDHSLQANARHDEDSEFGGKSTSALAYGYAISPTLRATASTGTAFRVPTLFQRFSIYGTSNLKAETSNNHEIGLRWLSGENRASVVVYHNDVDNLINYVSGPGTCINGVGAYAGCYGNTGHARMTGTTISGGTRVGNVNLGASVDWMAPQNLDTGKVLARRARNQAMLTADAPLADWRVAGELQYVGERFDNASNTTRLASYNLINVSASKQIDRDWKLLAKLNNLNDKNYVLANGYATPGRTFYLGLTWAPQK